MSERRNGKLGLDQTPLEAGHQRCSISKFAKPPCPDRLMHHIRRSLTELLTGQPQTRYD
jgi:hypothetical protein